MSKPHPREVLRGIESRARKRFGQNFLIDERAIGRIVKGAGVKAGDKVVEIGPGLGALTDALLSAGADLTAVELDRDLAAYLRVTHPNLTLIEADAAKVNWAEVCVGGGYRVVSNLPFNVGTQLLIQLSRKPEIFSSLTVMLQKEVVERITAQPGCRAYGALTVQLGARGTATPILTVPSSAFHPPPKIDAGVVRLDLYAQPKVGEVTPAQFDAVVKVAFSQRRKTIRNSLSANYGREVVDAALSYAEITPSVRAENLDLADYVRLASALVNGTN